MSDDARHRDIIGQTRDSGQKPTVAKNVESPIIAAGSSISSQYLDAMKSSLISSRMKSASAIRPWQWIDRDSYCISTDRAIDECP